MASLYISYFGAVSDNCAKGLSGSEVVTTSGTSAQATATDKGVVAMLFSDTAHYIKDGPNPTAATGSGVYLPANIPLWIALEPGYKFAAITV